MLTIEVRRSTRMVMEARGRFTAAPTPQAMRILRHWTQRTGGVCDALNRTAGHGRAINPAILDALSGR